MEKIKKNIIKKIGGGYGWPFGHLGVAMSLPPDRIGGEMGATTL